MAARKDDKDSAERAGGNGGAEPGAEAGRQSTERQATERQATERIRRSAGAGSEAVESSSRMAERGFAQVADLGRTQADQMRSLLGASARAYGDAGNLSSDDVDALVQTSARLAKGVQDMSLEVMQYTQQSLQMSMRVANDLMTCRTVEDMLNIQRDFMRQSVDTFLHESARLLEMSSNVATEAVNPLNDRFGGGMRQ